MYKLQAVPNDVPYIFYIRSKLATEIEPLFRSMINVLHI